jgi:mono/diheme cytochrome c family protein
MRRPLKVLLVTSALAAVAAFASACGTEKIKVSQSDQSLYRGAVLFSERCSGCHTLSYAATHGSASNVRNAEVTNGPNLDQRCERPVTRVLYAIQNGGFSGAIMPQNVVVGQDARDVAEFVSKFAGSKASKSPGVQPCDSQPIGTLPAPPSTASSASNGNGAATTASNGNGATTSASNGNGATKTASSGNGGTKHAKNKS